MRKQNLLRAAGISTLITAASIAVPTYAAPPVYLNNVANDVYISVIDIANNAITLEVNSDRESFLMVNGFVLQYGPLTDYQLHYWQVDESNGENVVLVNTSPTAVGSLLTTVRNKLTISDFWLHNHPISENNYYRIEYTAATTDSNAKTKGRADYSRCVNSSVFRSGLATQCRAEKTEGGMLQYQPYDADGNRLEIPAEEDAILTATTTNWRAEPGDWPASWYDEPEPEPVDPEPASPDPTEPDPVDPEPEEPEPTESENQNEVDVTIQADDTGVTTLASYVAVVESGGPTSVEAFGTTDANSDSSEDQSTTDSATEKSSEAESTLPEENMEVPILDKEPEKNWLAPVLISSGLAVAGVGWWLLFFGKKKLTDGKEEESRD